MSSTRAAVEHHDRGLRLLDERPDLLARRAARWRRTGAPRCAAAAGRARSRRPDARARAAGTRWCRACGRARTPAGCTPGRRAPAATRSPRRGCPCSVPSRITPTNAIERPAELDPAHAADGAEFLRLDQVDRVGDHHRRQRRLRHQARSPARAAASCATAAAAVTSSAIWVRAPARRLTAVCDGAAAGGHGARAGRRPTLAEPVRQQLAVRRRRRLAAARRTRAPPRSSR